MYSVVLFYKCWVCIICFGVLNGLVLLPVVLSFIGPVDYREGDPIEKSECAKQESEGDELKKVQPSLNSDVKSDVKSDHDFEV